MGTLEFGSPSTTATRWPTRCARARASGRASATAASQPDGVDPAILAAVQRGLTDPILIENITSIEIFKADTSGQPVSGKINKYDRDGNLDRHRRLAGDEPRARPERRLDRRAGRATTSTRRRPWPRCSGSSPAEPAPYTTIQMTDTTVMRLEPTP